MSDFVGQRSRFHDFKGDFWEDTKSRNVVDNMEFSLNM